MIKQESRAYFKALGAHIAYLRKSRGLTQAELARAIGVSQQAVFAYELGQRRVSVLLLTKISRLFSISMEELVGIARPVRVDKRKISPKAMWYAERMQALPEAQKRLLGRMIDTFEDMGRNRNR